MKPTRTGIVRVVQCIVINYKDLSCYLDCTVACPCVRVIRMKGRDECFIELLGVDC